jgi:CBS-domain-containing membrane protein
MAALAMVTDEPFVIPSLGPTAYLLFATPLAATASPRNSICGHLIGAAAGYLSLLVFGLTDAPAVFTADVEWTRVGAAALSLGLTTGLMIVLRVPHPPAAATTLLIALGVLREPWELVVVMLAVVLLVAQAFAINRAVRVPYPVWAPVAAADDVSRS